MPNQLCKHCGKLFGSRHAGALYCGRACWRDTRRQREVDRDARIIDGLEQGRNGPLRDHYEVVCQLCGRAQGEYFLSRVEVEAMKRLPQCRHCGGFCMLSPLFSCGVSSATKAKIIRTKAAPVRIRRVA